VERGTVFYDGTCKFCIGQASRLKRLTRGRVAFQSAYSEGVRDRFPMLPPFNADGKMGEMKFVGADGTVTGGAAAVTHALVAGGGPLGLVARIYWLWPVRPLADRAYRFIAARRYGRQGRCEDGSCEL
jgi:predicted DCC family thiol-disulfide oxidoreductase YuxK